jgi:hypothetical protein
VHPFLSIDWSQPTSLGARDGRRRSGPRTFRELRYTTSTDVTDPSPRSAKGSVLATIDGPRRPRGASFTRPSVQQRGAYACGHPSEQIRPRRREKTGSRRRACARVAPPAITRNYGLAGDVSAWLLRRRPCRPGLHTLDSASTPRAHRAKLTEHGDGLIWPNGLPRTQWLRHRPSRQKSRQKIGEKRSRASEPRTQLARRRNESPAHAHDLPSPEARPRGFEPLTFGSVDRRSTADRAASIRWVFPDATRWCRSSRRA